MGLATGPTWLGAEGGAAGRDTGPGGRLTGFAAFAGSDGMLRLDAAGGGADRGVTGAGGAVDAGGDAAAASLLGLALVAGDSMRWPPVGAGAAGTTGAGLAA